MTHAKTAPASELGLFLRRRREQLDPLRLGLPVSGRRRTPGLRREEVAQLAGVSTTWYTWLEQGREVSASAMTLKAISAALQCNETEYKHLLQLSGFGEPQLPETGPVSVSPATRQILAQLSPMPALVENARFDILGWNPAYEALMGVDIAALPAEERNCLFLLFTHPQWYKRLENLDCVQIRTVGIFRAGMARYRNDALWQERLDSLLSASADFRELWHRYDVRELENVDKHFTIPGLGALRLHGVNWWSAPVDGERLMVYVPETEDDRQRLEQLTSGTGSPRAVQDVTVAEHIC